jgi:opacity protein-like surface antigen
MRKAFVGIALATTLLTTPAIARDGSPYAGIEGGVLFGDGTDGSPIAVETERGWDLDALLGYDFGAFRIEGEAGYKMADADRITSTGIDIDPGTAGVQTAAALNGDLTVKSLMANALVDLGSDQSVNFYAGGGVGYAWVDLDGTSGAANTAFLDDSDSGFAWQLIAGVRVPVTPNVDLGLKYRYFNVDNLNMLSRTNAAFDTDLQTHSALASLLFNFGAAPAPLPAPMPVRAAPMPAPVAPPAPQTRTCPDGTVVMASQACPVPPPPVVPRTGERG